MSGVWRSGLLPRRDGGFGRWALFFKLFSSPCQPLRRATRRRARPSRARIDRATTAAGRGRRSSPLTFVMRHWSGRRSGSALFQNSRLGTLAIAGGIVARVITLNAYTVKRNDGNSCGREAVGVKSGMRPCNQHEPHPVNPYQREKRRSDLRIILAAASSARRLRMEAP